MQERLVQRVYWIRDTGARQAVQITPVIHCVERPGMIVRVQASDDICVAGVRALVE